jgi:hypothetical protein
VTGIRAPMYWKVPSQGIDLPPVPLENGVRLFERRGMERIEPERTGVIAVPAVTRLTFRVVKQCDGGMMVARCRRG